MKKILPYIMTISTIIILIGIIVQTDNNIVKTLLSIPLNFICVLGGVSLYDTISDWVSEKKQIKKKPLGLIKKIKKHKFL